MSRKLPKGKDSVLIRQKLNRRKKPLGKELRRWLAPLALLAALVIAVIAYRTTETLREDLVKTLTPPKTDWRVSLKVDGDTPLSEATARQVVAKAKSLLNSGNANDLALAAAEIQSLQAFARVHLLRTGDDHVVVHLKERVPVACVKADRLRFLTSEGDVYGEAPTEPGTCSGPIVTGVFGHQEKLGLGLDHTIILADEERAVLLEALALNHEARQHGFVVREIDYRKYRGFFVQMTTGELEVALGRTPFKAKLKKLQDILTRLAQKGDEPQRIELDYQGKAFIKLRKM